MNVLNTINKALPRVSALLTLFLINLSVIAQDSVLKAEAHEPVRASGTTKDGFGL